jgi:hypothetical protein
VKCGSLEVTKIEQAPSKFRGREGRTSKVAVDETCVVEFAMVKFSVLEICIFETASNERFILDGLLFEGHSFE